MEIAIKNYRGRIPVNPKKLKAAILKLLRKEGINSAEITVLFTTAERIRKLNRRYHRRDCATDVLAFDLGSRKGKNIFADIVVSADAAIRNAKIYQTSESYELYLYVLHGLLHLTGYDDRTAKQRRIMELKVSEILR